MSVPTIFIDTTVLVADLQLNGVWTRYLLEAAKNKQLALVIAEVTIRETVRKFQEKLEEAVAELRKASHNFSRITGEPDPSDGLDSAYIESTTKLYEGQLRLSLAEACANVRQIPSSDIAHMLGKAIKKSPPFSVDGKGFRDQLIWDSLVGFLETTNSAVAFVTNDKDFYNGSTLHEQLLMELDQFGFGRERIKAYSNLKDLMQELFPQGQSVDIVQAFYSVGMPGYTAITNWSEVTLPNLLDGLTLDRTGLDLPLGTTSAWVAGVYGTGIPFDITASSGPDDLDHIAFKVYANVNIDLHVNRSFYYELENSGDYFLMDNDPGLPDFGASFDCELLITAEVLVKRSAEQADWFSFRIENIETFYGPYGTFDPEAEES